MRKTLDSEALPEAPLNRLDSFEGDDQVEVEADHRLHIRVDCLAANHAVVDTDVGQQHQQLIEQIGVIHGDALPECKSFHVTGGWLPVA